MTYASEREQYFDGASKSSRPPRNYNRIRIILIHTPRYAIEGPARLAADVGVSRSTISRIMNGRTSPSYRLVEAITRALSVGLKRPLYPEDVFSPDGAFPREPSGCRLCGCRGCFPDCAYDGRGNRKSPYKEMAPGDWSLAPARISEAQAT